MKLLFMAAEAAPYAKVGGLADVAGALPPALVARGHEVCLLLPRHPTVAKALDLRPAGDPFLIDFDWRPRVVALQEAGPIDGVRILALTSPDYFNRSQLYGEFDDDKRYLFLARAGLEAVRRLGWQPDLLHAHDWHTAAAVNRIQVAERVDDFYRGTATVFTIHNLAYQGLTDLGSIGLLGVEAGGLLPIERAQFPNQINLLARGIAYADAVTTVSPSYAREIQTVEYGEGLATLLQERAGDLVGILNGIDQHRYDPANDPHLAARFDARQPRRREANKAALQRQVGLPEESVPLIGIVARLADQKGFDLLAAALPALLARGVQLVLLGTGEARYHDFWQTAAQTHASQVAAALTFDAGLAQLIYGGSDLFLMPSRFEPCGLGQLISMRYGSIPVVRATGGLVDSVVDADTMPSTGTGFMFGPYAVDALIDAVDRALVAYRQPARWQAIMRRAMSQDHSWERAADAYEAAYQTALERARITA